MTMTLRRLVLALTCVALCAAPLAACGSDDDAEEILEQTFGKSASSIDDGKLDLSFQLDPEGLLALGGPIKLALEGPFAAPRADRLPRFDLDFVATLARQRYAGALASTGTRAYLTAGRRSYRVDEAFVAKLRAGLTRVRGAGAQPGLTALGLDPLRWIEDPETKGEATVAGVETIRIGATVDAAALLEDLDGLLTRAGGGGGAVLAPQLRTQLAEAVDSATVDVWTGAEDRLVRQLAVRAVFAFDEGQASPIQGLEGGTINLRVRLEDVNETKVSVSTPAGARPLSALTGGGMDAFLDGVGSGLSSGAGEDDGRDFLRCITNGQGDTPALIRCISKVGA